MKQFHDTDNYCDLTFVLVEDGLRLRVYLCHETLLSDHQVVQEAHRPESGVGARKLAEAEAFHSLPADDVAARAQDLSDHGVGGLFHYVA